ncbi:coat protein [Army ant associated cyclovirus 9]|uniref:Coat protein n=1 Tax=army ant associated cyclovirus 9 183_1 TaxID=3070169 RepID=A0AA47LW52_9CIRC|nr:coat protein [Army ant associated cyclovirus 9]WBG01487.1 coat protein [Army ant associated cyclovirus 9]
MVRRMIRRRRYVRRTRLPFKRRYRFPRRYRRHFKRRRTSNYTMEARHTQNVIMESTQGQVVIVAPTLYEFNELVGFADKFEAYRFQRVTVKITPTANTSDATDQVTHYVTAPWHRKIETPANVTTNALLSVDRAREYQGNSTSRRTYVPAVSTVTAYGSGDDFKTSLSVIKFRPRIENVDSNALNLPHYCALIAFDQTANAESAITYQITTTVRCTFYNQKAGF